MQRVVRADSEWTRSSTRVPSERAPKWRRSLRACGRERSTSSSARSVPWARARGCAARSRGLALLGDPLRPAGTGKTSLARIIARCDEAHFDEVSAVTSGVADLRRAIDRRDDGLRISGQRTILFIDEIHRFSKSQQDALLHAVEDRVVMLIGATTENPFFEVNAPLVSRSRVVELEPLSDEEVRRIVASALSPTSAGLAARVTLDADAEDAIVIGAGVTRGSR